ncbi:MAG TPA: hypothetical protein VIE38_09800 [Gaiellaceae bacterium]|jgi:hypothetical protein
MHRSLSESYMEIFNAAMTAAVDRVRQLPDEEIARLTRYSGVVGLAAEHVKASRTAQNRKTG